MGDDLVPLDPELCRAIVAGTSALLCVIDSDGRILLFNAALERATGWTAGEVLGRRFVDVLAVPEEAALAAEAIADALVTGVAPPQEGEWLDRHGGRRRVALQNSVLRDSSGRGWAYVCVGLDVTARREEEAQLRYRADTDLLTGLANRGAFFTALERALGTGTTTCGLLFCDLDGFKLANDEHGHAVGDAVLAEVAARLRGLLTPDDLAARIGGDEFVVLVRPADPGRLAALAEAVRTAVRQPVAVGCARVRLGVSVGTALATPGVSADQLVAAADREMYAVKPGRARGRSADRER